MSTGAEPKRPRVWKYLLVAAAALVVLIPTWTLLVVLVIQPQTLMQEPNVGKQLMWFVAVPALAVLGLVGGNWQAAAAQSRPSSGQGTVATGQQESAASTADLARREYVLEIISVGVTLDKYRQGKLWEALSNGHPVTSIREQDPKKYPWSANEKEGMEGGRGGDTLENGAKFTPTYWGIPSFYADSAVVDPVKRGKPAGSVVGGLVGGVSSSGMVWNLFVPADWELSERPDRLLARVFDYFDKYPEVPFVVLSAADGMYFRDMYRPKGTPPLIKDGYYIPEMPDASTMLVLARRERVDAVRKFVWEEPVDEGLTRKLYLAHLDFENAFVNPKDSTERDSAVIAWLAATRAFTQRDDIYPRGFSLLHPFTNHPPKEYKPTPWFPLPWTKDQFAIFDRLPTLGYLHRPIFVPMTDKDGKPLARRDERAAALAAGWQQALQTLPEAERQAAPARVIAATAGNVEQTIALTSVLDDWTARGGPEIDKSRATQWINTDARLGNTGAATWFLQMAIGVMGSYREGGTSAAINLRDPSEASIVFITPPSEAKRKSQHHPEGGDVFRHYATPAIDPANYTQ